MSYEVSKVNIWSGLIEDRPGTLADKLEAIEKAGGDLDFIVVRPADDVPASVLFVAPLEGAQQAALAEELGLRVSERLRSLRVAGPNRPGLAAKIARTLARASINIVGVTAATHMDHAILYYRFGSDGALDRAMKELTEALR